MDTHFDRLSQRHSLSLGHPGFDMEQIEQMDSGKASVDD